MTRQRNDGVRKICSCPRRVWSKCGHAWHFNFKWAGKAWRFSLDEQLGKHVDSKTLAETEAENMRVAIRAGAFVRVKRGVTLAPPEDLRPTRDRLTVGQLLDQWLKRRGGDIRPSTLQNDRHQIAAIKRTELELATGETRAFGEWLVADVTGAVVQQFKDVRQQSRQVTLEGEKRPRRSGGIVATNRNLALLSQAFDWGTEQEYLAKTPFRKGERRIVRPSHEDARSRRLQDGEADRLLDACGQHLRALVEAALETGCRKGELLSLQWHQVRLEGRPELHLPAQKTKTKAARTIPVSTRLKAFLEARRHDPDGEVFSCTAYVFGNEIGQRVTTIKTAWRLTLKRARIQDLHFHDLRREAGSRWLEAGVPLHRIQAWLGHSNISQTSTYLRAAMQTAHDDMAAFEQRLGRLQPVATEVGTSLHDSTQTDTELTEKPQEKTN